MRAPIVGLILCLAWTVWADKVYLTDGTVLQGKVRAKTDEKILFEYERGKLKTISRGDVEKMELDSFQFPPSAVAPPKSEAKEPASGPATPPQVSGPASKQPQAAQPKWRAAAASGKSSQQKQDYSEAIKLGMDNLLSADLATISRLTGVNDKLKLLQVLGLPNSKFIRKDGGELNRFANKEAFNAAIANITPEKISAAMKLVVGRVDKGWERFYGLSCLLAASGSFVFSKGKFSKDPFNSALAHMTMTHVQKTQNLLRDKDPSEPLYLLLRAASHFVTEEGKFEGDPFDKALDALTADKIAAKLKEMKVNDPEAASETWAFVAVMQPPAP